MNNNSIAVVNSASGSIVDVTILEQSKSQELNGAMTEFTVESEDRTQYVLGRMSTVKMSSLVHENKSFAPVIAKHGHIAYFSRIADVHSATIEVISAVDKDGRMGPLVCPPYSSTPISKVGTNGLNKYWPEKKYFAVVGHLPQHEDIPLSVINRSFCDPSQGGWGEAKHTAYFGRNGSGKTVKAAMDVVCQLAAHQNMGALIPDTAGDLSRAGSHDKGDFYFDMFSLLEAAGRIPRIVEIRDVALASQDVFASRLSGVLLRRISTSGEKADEVARVATEHLFGDDDVNLSFYSESKLLEALRFAIEISFSKRTQDDKLNMLDKIESTSNIRKSFFKQIEEQVIRLFTGDVKIGSLVKDFLNKGEIVIIKMYGIPSQDQREVMLEIFSKTKRSTEQAFHATGEMVNAMIVLDEGPRWVPQDQSKQDAVAKTIVDAFNTTRKYGLGWTIISQRITAIAKDVLAQCHTVWYGKGLGIGADAEHIKAALGQDGWSQYQDLQLHGGYPWIGIGDAINLGAGTQYITLNPYGGNSNEALIEANPQIWHSIEEHTGF